MAVFTAAALAVGAAIATTTFATVATAVVAVSAAVGIAGLAVSVVGMATGNEDLMKAGEIMGYVGLAGGLAGGVIGGVGGMMSGGGGFLAGAKGAYTGAAEFAKQGWDKGVGSLFSSSVADDVVAPVANGGNFTQAPGAKQGVGQFPAPGGSTGPSYAGVKDVYNAPVSNITPVNVLDATKGQTAGTQMMSTANQAAAHVAPKAGILGAPAVAPVSAPLTQAPSMMDGFMGVQGAASGGSSAAASAASAFSEMPDWMKMTAMTTGLQGISGLASGWFQGASAEEKLEFEKLINAQRQGQIDYQNKNAAYAPLLNFAPKPGPSGLLQT